MNSLRTFLAGMAAFLVLLAAAAAALVAHQVAAIGRVQSERQLLDTSRALSLVVDGKLQSYAAVLDAITGSEPLKARDWAGLDRTLRSVLRDPDAWMVVVDRTGGQRVDTSHPSGARPHLVQAAMDWKDLDRGRMRICNLAQGPLKPPVLCVEAPVMEKGRAAYAVSIQFRPKLLDRVVDRGIIRQGHFAAIIDRNGRVIWRNVEPQRFIGRPATPDLRAAMARKPDGVMESVSLEGVPTLMAYSRSRVSGWTFLVAMPRREAAAPREGALRYGLGAAAVLLALGVTLGLVAGGRLAKAINGLNLAVARAGRGEPPAYEPSGFQEVDEVGAALDAALRDRDLYQERFGLAQDVGGIGAWDWDLQTDEGHVSDSYKAMHGLVQTPGPLRIDQVLAVIHPEDIAGYKARLTAAFQRPEPSTNDYRVVLPDGSFRWIYAKGRPLIGPDGTPRRAIGVVIDLTERKDAEDRMALLMREVDHRANNVLAVVQSIVSLTRANTAADFRRIVLGRVEALAHAHKLLADSRWAGADLRRLIQEELGPYMLGDADRVTLRGPIHPLTPAAAQGLGMALHELATNAAKYGALSTSAGKLTLEWTVRGRRLRLIWTESGGPTVSKPTRRGYGATVIERALTGVPGGKTSLTWRPEGLVCEIEIAV